MQVAVVVRSGGHLMSAFVTNVLVHHLGHLLIGSGHFFILCFCSTRSDKDRKIATTFLRHSSVIVSF